MASEPHWTVPRPWQQLPVEAAPWQGRLPPEPTQDTLYESCEGEFLGESGFVSQASATRRCYVFSPAPIESTASAPGFRAAQVRHSVVGHLEGEAGLASWLHTAGSCAGVRLQSWAQRSLLRLREADAIGPVLAWHPDCLWLASVCHGHVAVHSFGDGLVSETSTEHLHAEMRPLAAAWQPCDLQGSLAVAGTTFLALWRRTAGSWLRVWALQGEAFGSSALSWSPDGRVLAAAAAPNAVHILGPHSELTGEALPSHFIRLRRWSGGGVLRLAWSPESTLLAALHSEPMVRLWKTRTWEVAAHVSLGWIPAGLPGFSLSWLDGDTLLATGGHLVQIGVGSPGAVNATNAHLGQDSGLFAWLSGAEPVVRALPLPQEGAVQEVAVCPRTAQRVAVRQDNHRDVLIFERATCGLAGWSHRELTPCGRLAAPGATPLALSFAAHRPRLDEGSATEGSLLAVYWQFDDGRGEVRTYPFHFLPAKLLQASAATSALF